MSEVPSSKGEIRFLAKTLSAAILYPHVGGDSKRACDIAEELIRVTEERQKEQKAGLEAWARRNIRIEKSWADRVKHVTGEKRSFLPISSFYLGRPNMP